MCVGQLLSPESPETTYAAGMSLPFRSYSSNRPALPSSSTTKVIANPHSVSQRERESNCVDINKVCLIVAL